ncbi:gluconate kinase (SKI family) [Rhizobium azibense]|uniref:Gluconokinase n=2 Tax=Rhizobium/Agrobacterium group TaxID=227290 RepID=A0A4R3S101_9HYPH|nr:gluconate kinase (SKI family) [Rhizobium azibense]
MLTVASRPLFKVSQRLVLMGVAGCGKSSVGAALAARLGAVYLDGDDLHPSENIDKMRRGMALDDEDRWPWLTLVGRKLSNSGGPQIVGCSALKRAYRIHITQTCAETVTFVHLAGTPEVIKARMNARKGHFMPTGLLTSQFAALEPPGADENAFSVDIDRPLGSIVEAIVTQLEGMKT